MNTYNPYRLFHGSFIPNWLGVRTELSAAAKFCFARLCQYAGEDGKCFPKVETLALALGMKKRMTQRYLRELEKFKLIKVIAQGHSLPNRYIFIWHEWISQQNQMVSDMTPPPMSDMTSPYKETHSNNINILLKSENEEEKSKAKEIKKSAQEVLEYLNNTASSSFRIVDSNLRGIIALLITNVSVNECKTVIDVKTKEWKNTEMEKYLRPATLFRRSKFENYLGQYTEHINKVSSKPKKNTLVYYQTEIDKQFPMADNLSTRQLDYNQLQRDGIASLVKNGDAIIQNQVNIHA
ncbi:MAG: conserved phage C-terminal domain-containing protein [Candidatus Bathyarchaeia archaeon]